MALTNITDQNVQYPNRFTILADGTNGTINDAALNGKVIQLDFSAGLVTLNGTPLNALELNKLITQINTNDLAIVSNDTDISTNTGNIAANLAAIQSNDTDIGVNAGGVSTNLANIATNLAAIALNTTHRSSDGKNHSDVVFNNTHRSSDGKNHADVVLNNTHRSSDGKNHADVVLNNSHRTSDGKHHSDVVLNNTHRISDGKNHSDVVANNAKVGITVGQAADIVTNTAKTGITTQQASDITTNNNKTGITAQESADILVNNDKLGITVSEQNQVAANTLKISYPDALEVAANTLKNSYPSGDATKVGFISVTEAVDLDALALAVGEIGTGIEGALPLSGGTMRGVIVMTYTNDDPEPITISYKITDLSDPTNNQDAATKIYVDSVGNLKLALTGGTMSGALAMGSNKITGLANATEDGDAVNLSQMNTFAGNYALLSGPTFSGDIDMNSNKILEIRTVDGTTGDTEAVPKLYVDGIVSGYFKADGTINMSGNLNLNTNRLTNVGTPEADGDAVPRVYVDAAESDANTYTDEQIENYGYGRKVASGTLVDPTVSIIVDPSIYGNGEYRLIFKGHTTVNSIRWGLGSSMYLAGLNHIDRDAFTGGMFATSTFGSATIINLDPTIIVSGDWTVAYADRLEPSASSSGTTFRREVRNGVAGQNYISLVEDYIGTFTWELYKIK